jgi:uncharacterized membrane protein YgdD (TMEM256/DUF423 family)
MSNRSLVSGCISAALAVILGAFAAHGLEKHLESGLMDLHQMEIFETGARYQMYHAFALIAVGLIAKLYGESKLLKTAMWLFVIGILFFCGSLYLLATRNVLGLENWTWLGPITPLGGLCFISGWSLLAVAIIRKK